MVIFTINQVLQCNEGSLRQLSRYKGKKFSIEVIGMKINSQITSDGTLESVDSDKYDVIIKIPMSNVKYFIDQDKLSAIQNIKFIGDMHLGLAIIETFANLHLYFLPNGIKKINIDYSIIKMIVEYIVQEKQTIVSSNEINDFCDEVDSLRAKVELLEQRQYENLSSN